MEDLSHEPSQPKPNERAGDFLLATNHDQIIAHDDSSQNYSSYDASRDRIGVSSLLPSSRVNGKGHAATPEVEEEGMRRAESER